MRFYSIFRAEEAYRQLKKEDSNFQSVFFIAHVDSEHEFGTLGTKKKPKKKKAVEYDGEGFAIV